MGRIFISAGHGGIEQGGRDLGVIAGGTTEAQEMISLRDKIVPELRSRGFEVLSVPDELSLRQTIEWINARARPKDVALEIHTGFASNPEVGGASTFYITNNSDRKKHAELMLLALQRSLPQLENRGAKPDTAAGFGRLAFCRDTVLPSIQMEIGYLTNPSDRALIQNRRAKIAQGIADGLAAWSRAVSGSEPAGELEIIYPSIDLKINNQIYDEQGIIVNGNAYIPIDLADRLGVDLTRTSNVRRFQYRGVVYVKAIELREFNISVGWESATRTLILRSILKICPGFLDRIIGHGNTSTVQLMMFLKANNDKALAQFPDLAKLYREEAEIEGVNYDIAFSQAMVETNFMRFGGSLKSSQNNFGGLGDVAGRPEGATFSNARLGVRAHVQQLKAYASQEPLVQEQVSPRFRFITRGIAPLVEQLSGRWSADMQYGRRIMAVLRRLYDSAELL